MGEESTSRFTVAANKSEQEKFMEKLNLTLLTLLTAMSFNTFASDSWLQQSLDQYKQNPKEFLNTLPAKTNGLGEPLPPSDNQWFSPDEIENGSFINQKNKWRASIIPPKRGRGEKSLPGENDRVENFLASYTYINNLAEMEAQGLIKGAVDTRPWSDDYWPIYKGILGNRYGDSEFNYYEAWDEFHNYVIERPIKKLLGSNNPRDLDKLSPSEKYDLLLGADAKILTDRMWAEGKYYFDANGEVESWMGICHGWAPASYMMERPLNKIFLPSFDGKYKIPFYPADIKALASLLWAKVQTPVRFLGGRCNEKEPETDENGRIILKDCLDSNPATWHLAVINRLGKEKLSFVIDATYDYEVWNQPVISYEYAYFNPKTMKETDDLSEAKIALSDYPLDKFKKHRGKKTKYIVGVGMRLTYGAETSPRLIPRDDDSFDLDKSVYYVYDLELDANENIIGGEWYQNYHPDFMWTPPAGTKALTFMDYELLGSPLWDGKKPLPKRWIEGAKFMANSGTPLAKIVESLIQISRQEVSFASEENIENNESISINN